MTLGAARVIYTTKDLSAYVDNLVKGYGIMIVRSERGPVNDPKLVDSWESFQRVFGKLYAASDDPLVAKLALEQGARLFVIRIAHYTDVSDRATLTALSSSAILQDRGAEATAGFVESAAGPFTFNQALSGRVTSSEIGPYTIAVGVADKIKLRVGTPGAWGAEQEVTLTDGTRTAQQVCDEINAQTTGVNATVVDGKVYIEAIAVGDDLEIMAVAADVYSVLGLQEAVNSHVEGTDSLVIGVDALDDQTCDLEPTGGETGAFELTAGEIVSQLSGLTGATATAVQGKLRITSATTGTDSIVQIQVTSTAAVALGFDNDPHAGTAGTPQNTLKFSALDPGVHGDSIKVHIHASTLNPETAFNVRISYALDSRMNEYWSDLNMTEDDPNYVVTFINERSKMVRAEDQDSTNEAPGNRPAINDIGTPLTGGDDGLDGLTDADWIGDEASHTGLYAIDKIAGEMAIDIFIPGTTSVTVAQAFVNYCEQRAFMGYFNTPALADPEEAVDWRTGEPPSYTHEAFNSNRLSLWFGRPRVYDARTDSRKYVSNLGHLAAAICRNDRNYNRSVAPVGAKRGVVDFVEGIDFNLYEYPGYQDLFAEYQINYLKISRDKGSEGAMFWEQYTTQREASSLRNLNVMRFLTDVRRVLEPTQRAFIFDPNHPVTWAEVKRILDPIFRKWRDTNQIYDYCLQCDESAYWDGGQLKNAVLNSGLDIDQGIYHSRGLVQPTQAIRYFEWELGVTGTGVAFEKLTALKELPAWAKAA